MSKKPKGGAPETPEADTNLPVPPPENNEPTPPPTEEIPPAAPEAEKKPSEDPLPEPPVPEKPPAPPPEPPQAPADFSGFPKKGRIVDGGGIGREIQIIGETYEGYIFADGNIPITYPKAWIELV